MRVGSWGRLVSEISSLSPSEKFGKCDTIGVHSTNDVFEITDA